LQLKLCESNMTTDFIGGLTQRYSNTLGKILHHPYLICLDSKQITRESLKIFVCEQYHIISNDKRNFALMQQRASNANSLSADLFKDCVSFESSSLTNLTLLQNELNLDVIQLKSYNPLSGCQAYTNYLTKLCSYGSEGEVLVALLTDLPVWGKNCKRISSALKNKYKFTEDSCRFLDAFASPLPEEFLKLSNEIIESSLLDYRNEMERAARLILDYELMFWDTMYQYSDDHYITSASHEFLRELD
jgi:thiaminase